MFSPSHVDPITSRTRPLLTFKATAYRECVGVGEGGVIESGGGTHVNVCMEGVFGVILFPFWVPLGSPED